MEEVKKHQKSRQGLKLMLYESDRNYQNFKRGWLVP